MAGSVATFALIPEVIAFSFAAGVDPEVGLFASCTLSIVIAFFGGRSAMITAAAGSVALVAAPIVAEHGLEYLFAAGILAGVLQIAFGLLRLDTLMRYVSSPVRTGFVNALAILIFSAQLPHLHQASTQTWWMLALGLAIIYGFPRIPLPICQFIPSPLVCIFSLTLLSTYFHLPLKIVAQLGTLPDHLPQWHGFPHLPWTWQSLRLILFPALAIAMVGLLESMMTARVVDDLTQTTSAKHRECTGLGFANIVTAFFGGISGCGMIGQTVGNVRYGARGRLSTLWAGAFLLLLMLALRSWVMQVPVVALVAVMIMVSISTFDWQSLHELLRHPRQSSIIMLATVGCTLVSGDLAIGVLVGVLLSGLFFANTIDGLCQVEIQDHGDQRLCRITGHLFFASADALTDQLLGNDSFSASRVQIDLAHGHLWDVTAVKAIESIVSHWRAHGRQVQLVHLNRHSDKLVRQVASWLVEAT